MAIPSEDPIIIATQDVDLVNDPGTPNKVDVRATILDAGYGFEQSLLANELNKILNNHGLWLEYTQETLATTLIKDAEQDNRLDLAEADIASNDTDILDLYIITGNNTSDINTNTNDIATLTTQVNNLSSNVAALTTQVDNLKLPVGAVIELTGNGTSYTGQNPATLFGYGTWVQFAQGRTTIGVGATTDDRGETLNFSDTSDGGEFKHVTTEAEMPSHAHRLLGTTSGSGGVAALAGNIIPGDDGVGSGYTNSGDGGNQLVEDSGSNSPHNNMQPYVVVYKWLRTA